MQPVEVPDYSGLYVFVSIALAVTTVICAVTKTKTDSTVLGILKSLSLYFSKSVHQTGNVSITTVPLCDVTVFKGPNGIFSVAQDGDLWSVEKTPDARDNSFNSRESLPPGRTSFKTRFPIAPNDEHVGSFDRRDKAIKAAIQESGLWSHLDTRVHPIPDRKAAIAHTKAKS